MSLLLGVPRKIGDLDNTSDRDNLVNGWYVVSINSLPNWWFNNLKADGLLEVIITYSNFRLLRYTDFSTGEIYELFKRWGTWSNWVKITAGNV